MHNEQCSSSLFILNCSFLIPHSSFFSFRRRLGRPSALARRLLRLLAGQPGRRLRHRRRLPPPPRAAPPPRSAPPLPGLLVLPFLGVAPSPEPRVPPAQPQPRV